MYDITNMYDWFGLMVFNMADSFIGGGKKSFKSLTNFIT